MCRADWFATLIEECMADPYERNPWSKVFSGPCGRFIILCIFLDLMMFIIMVTYLGIYVNSVLNHPNIICVPWLIDEWRIKIPSALGLMFLGALCSIWFWLRKKGTSRCCYIHCCDFFGIFWSGFLFGTFIIVLIMAAEYQGVVIQEDNNNDIMFQYFFRWGEGPVAFPILLRPDDVNNTYSNSTCRFVTFSQRCNIPLRNASHLSGAFRCTPNGQEGLELLSLYFMPLLESLYTANKLGISFLIFFAFIYLSLMGRRLLPTNKWFGSGCCPSSYGEPEEHMKLI